jgi:hypothetical protein
MLVQEKRTSHQATVAAAAALAVGDSQHSRVLVVVRRVDASHTLRPADNKLKMVKAKQAAGWQGTRLKDSSAAGQRPGTNGQNL